MRKWEGKGRKSVERRGIRRNGKGKGETGERGGRKGSQGKGGRPRSQWERVRGRGKRRVRGQTERTGSQGKGFQQKFSMGGPFWKKGIRSKGERDQD